MSIPIDYLPLIVAVFVLVFVLEIPVKRWMEGREDRKRGTE